MASGVSGLKSEQNMPSCKSTLVICTQSFAPAVPVGIQSQRSTMDTALVGTVTTVNVVIASDLYRFAVVEGVAFIA
jgi:hypothetical protein